jgi:glycosyltransferase involved in cell wall biosynthesis
VPVTNPRSIKVLIKFVKNSSFKMKTGRTICFFNSNRKWGGGEKWHLEMASFTAIAGNSVVLACHSGSELEKKAKAANLEVFPICISNLSFLDPFKVFRIKKMLRKHKIDTLIVNLPSDLKVAGLAARMAGNVRVIYRRGSAIPVKNSLMNRMIFRKHVDDILVNSQETGRTILANNPGLFPAERIHVIYNGIDLQEFEKQEGTSLYQKQGDELILATAGRLSEQKGHNLLFKALQRLKTTGIPFRLLIAGDGEMKEEIMQMAQQMGLSENVTFLGFLENIKPLLDQCDIFLLPSKWEGFGYVLVEAMACRKPVIAFHASSNPEIVADGESGFLVKDFNTDQFAEMIFLLANNPTLRLQMGEKGRKRVEERFTLERAVKEMEALINFH